MKIDTTAPAARELLANVETLAARTGEARP